MWNVYSLDGPHTNNHAEGWHSKVVSLFKSEQAATEVTFFFGGGGDYRQNGTGVHFFLHEMRLDGMGLDETG